MATTTDALNPTTNFTANLAGTPTSLVGTAAPQAPNPATGVTNTEAATSSAPFDPNSISKGTLTPNAQGVPAITPSQITSSAQWNNTPDQTVSGQVNGIIAANSPIMQQARTNALENMNNRGLLNSSMAETAGQSAVYNAALPIAQADAAQASKVAGANFQNQSQDQLTNLNAQNAANSQNLNVAAQAQNQAVQNAAAQSIAQIEAQYKELTQGSSSAANLVSNAQSSITQILQNTNMDAGAKQAAIDQIKANLQNSMGLIGSLSGNVDLQKYLA